MINYFKILNVSEDAEIEVIRASYKALVKKYHPDNVNSEIMDAVEKMKIINEAYRVLSDDITRNEHISALHRAKVEENSQYFYENSSVSAANSYCNEEVFFSTETEKNISLVIKIAIVISLICCIVYFLPEVLCDAWENFQVAVEDVINTF